MEQEEELIVDMQYLKGFNQGYVLAEYTPDLVNILLKNDLPANEYFTGFKAGNEEYSIEKARDRRKNITSEDAPSKDAQRNKER